MYRVCQTVDNELVQCAVPRQDDCEDLLGRDEFANHGYPSADYIVDVLRILKTTRNLVTVERTASGVL